MDKINVITLTASDDKGMRWCTAFTHRGDEKNCRMYSSITPASLERLQRAQKRLIAKELPQATA